MMKIAVDEIQSQNLCDFSFSAGWEARHHPLIGHDVQMAASNGASIRIQCPREVCGVWLLRHGWSGIAEVSCSGETTVVDLWEEKQDIDYVVPLPKRSSEPFELELRLSVPSDRQPTRSEVWLLGFAFEAMPHVRTKSVLLSQSTRVIRGEWGRFLVLTNDTAIPTAILNEGAWAPRDIDVFRRFVKPGDAVLDIGANFGHHSVVFAELVGVEGLVVAIEAQKVMYQLLNANCVINAKPNIVPVHVAASDHEHEVTLYPVNYAGETNFGSLGVNPDPTKYSSGRVGEIVKAVRMDDLLERICPERRITFIKIDVQSYEKYVLEGLTRTLEQHRPAIFLEISPYWMQRAGYDYRDTYKLLLGLGYSIEHMRDVPLSADGLPTISPDTDVEWDIVAVPS